MHFFLHIYLYSQIREAIYRNYDLSSTLRDHFVFACCRVIQQNIRKRIGNGAQFF